ncbi:MAG: hypothetical protein Q8L26_04210 [Candidatus Omnitrophota bacterium]|nr:hypothetical protein [Candidatus Omnitrophota bacterium]
MYKKLLIISIGICAIVSSLFGLVKLMEKTSESYYLKIPYSSYCAEFQSGGINCDMIGGNLIFESDSERPLIYFKRELTNNSFEIDLKNKIIQQMQHAFNNDSAPAYSPCNPDRKYCAAYKTKGILKKGGGIGFWVSPDKLFGLEIFEIKSMQTKKTFFRKMNLKFGGASPTLKYDTFWSEDGKYVVIFDNSNNLIIQRIKE